MYCAGEFARLSEQSVPDSSADGSPPGRGRTPHRHHHRRRAGFSALCHHDCWAHEAVWSTGGVENKRNEVSMTSCPNLAPCPSIKHLSENAQSISILCEPCCSCCLPRAFRARHSASCSSPASKVCCCASRRWSNWTGCSICAFLRGRVIGLLAMPLLREMPHQPPTSWLVCCRSCMSDSQRDSVTSSSPVTARRCWWLGEALLREPCGECRCCHHGWAGHRGWLWE